LLAHFGAGADALLDVRNLVKRYGGLVATNEASFSVVPGEVHALIGPNGAGKTTLIHLISGGLKPDSGAIIFEGTEITRLPMHVRVHRGLSRSYQITNVFRRLSALDNVALAVQAHGGASFSMLRPVIRETALFDEARSILDQVGLLDRAAEEAKSLSHGEQRQLEVALALATRPRLLLLDEPMAGMGPDELQRMVRLLQSLKRQITLLLVEHDMDTVFRLADRISVLVYGRVIATGSPDEIRADPEVRKAYLGEESAA
jgi:branched-chain amino acid transport system ATP-binding protein